MLQEFREQHLTWDKANRRIHESVKANASDAKGRKLTVQVLNDGVVEDLTGTSLSLYWETRSKQNKGLDAFDVADASQGIFELYYTTGMLSNEGKLRANLVLVDDLGKIVSDAFVIEVSPGIDENAVKSTDSFTALTKALVDIKDLEQNYAPRLNDITAQLDQKATKQSVSMVEYKKADKDYVDAKVSGLNNFAPKPFADLNAIISAYPKGDNNHYLNLEDGNWYYWNGMQWVAGGVYQAIDGDASMINVNKTVGVSSSNVQSALTELGVNLTYQMPVKNEISNGNFEDETGWIQANAALTFVENRMSIKGTGDSAGPSVYKDTEVQAKGQQIFARIKLDVKSPTVTRIRIQVRGTSGGADDFYDVSTPSQGEHEAFGVVQLDDTFSGIIRFYIVTVYDSVEDAADGEVIAEKAVMVDLTNTFGKGHEPLAGDFNQMLDRYPNKYFDGITGPLMNFKEYMDYYKDEPVNELKAYPKTQLQYEVIKKPLIPISIGYDGGVYGMRSTTTAYAIHRTYDAYETVEDGFNFSGLLDAGDYISYVCQMPGGIVVVASNSNNYTSKVFHSENFNSGFMKVLDIPNGIVNTWAVDAPVFTFGRGVLLLSEYAQDATDKYIYVTYDGGATWEQLIKNETVDVNERSHWHSATFDEVRSRIYVSQGDMANTMLKYTDDFGKTWHKIEYDLDTPLQPTVMPILNDKLIYSPDRSIYPVSIWTAQIDKSMKFTTDIEKFEVEHAHTVTNNTGSHKQFGGYPVVKTGTEMIMSFTDRGANNKKTYFAATGDGGNTWHNIFLFDWSKSTGIGGASRGIVGYDKNGFMYIHTQYDGEHRILKCHPLEWVYA